MDDVIRRRRSIRFSPLRPGLLRSQTVLLHLRNVIEKAEKAAQNDPGHHDIVMQLGGVHLMTASWSDAVPNINSCTLVKLPDHIRLWMGMGVGDRVAARALTVNLSSRLRVLHRALADAHSAEIEAENKRRKGVSKVRLKR